MRGTTSRADNRFHPPHRVRPHDRNGATKRSSASARASLPGRSCLRPAGAATIDDAELRLAWQVDRKGVRRPTKPDGSARTVPIPRELAVILVRHKLASRFAHADDFVFATRTGTPIRQRNVQRALRNAQRDAVDADGRPTFRSSIRSMVRALRRPSHTASCPRWTASGTRSRAALCWRGRALTRSPSFSDTETQTSRVPCTSGSSVTFDVARCVARGWSPNSATSCSRSRGHSSDG
jgi:hypothetical protein